MDTSTPKDKKNQQFAGQYAHFSHALQKDRQEAGIICRMQVQIIRLTIRKTSIMFLNEASILVEAHSQPLIPTF